MGIVTALEMQKRNKERVNVYLDGEYAFSLTLMEAAKLKKGQTLSEADVQQLQAIDDVHKAVDRAARFLSYRPRSTQEVRQNLLKNGTSEEVTDLALERLAHLGYLDDVAFTRFWLENRDLFKPRGPMALRYELRQKGIADSIIDTALEALDEDDAAYRAALPRVRRLRGASQQAFRQKLSNFLQRRGFSYATSRDAITQIIAETVADDPEFFADDDTTS